MFGVDLHHQLQTYHLSQAPSCDPVHSLSRTFIPKKKQAAMIGEGGSIISREPALVGSSPELFGSIGRSRLGRNRRRRERAMSKFPVGILVLGVSCLFLAT